MGKRRADKRPQKTNGIKNIGFAHAVAPGKAGDRAEMDVDIKQILEAANLQSCQHMNPFVVWLPSGVKYIFTRAVSQTGEYLLRDDYADNKWREKRFVVF